VSPSSSPHQWPSGFCKSSRYASPLRTLSCIRIVRTGDSIPRVLAGGSSCAVRPVTTHPSLVACRSMIHPESGSDKL
jgi:hypothetical protein